MKTSHQRRTIWRWSVGPLLTLAIACVMLTLMRSGIQVPLPGAFMLVSIVLSSYLGGATAGYLSAAIGVVCGLVLLSDPEVVFTPDREFRRQLLFTGGLILPVLVNYLRIRFARALEQERAMRERAEAANRELLSLRAELVRHAQKLERLATIDDLTGLSNRRHFLALAEDEWHRHALEQPDGGADLRHRPLQIGQ